MGNVKFNSKGYQFHELARKYKNFYAPCFKVSADGRDPVSNGVGISQVRVETGIDKADAFSLRVTNAYDLARSDFDWIDRYFFIGNNIEIKMGYADILETVFVGLITSIKFDFPQDGSPTVVVGGMDARFLMTKGVKSRSWLNKKHSDVAKMIAREYASKVEVDDTPAVHDIVEQSRATDYQFLTWLAAENNFEFFMAGKTLFFRKPYKNKTPVVTLEAGKNLHSFNVNVDIGGQTPLVVVRYHDVKTGRDIEGTSGQVAILGSGRKTGPDMMRAIFRHSVVDHKYTKVSSPLEAEAKATAELNAKAMKLVTGSGECTGIPEIRAGRCIKIAGAGRRLSTLYYITSATHTVSDSGYSTSFNIGGNAI